MGIAGLGATVATLSETETSFAPLLYFPSRLSGLVDFFGELYSENPGRAQIMPDGKVEIAFFLGDSEISEFYLAEDEEYDRGSRNSFSLLFSVANRPQIVSGKCLHVLLAVMSPAVAMLMFGVPASELSNRTVNPAMFGVNLNPLEDALKSLPTFEQRAEFLENWMVNRLEQGGSMPEFISLSRAMVDIFHDSRRVPNTYQVLDLTGYSKAHANRLAKQWLGMPLERYTALRRYRKALALLNTSLPLVDVASAAGYFDQAHFTHRFTEYSGLSPSEYRATPRAGADTLFVA